MDMLEEMFLPPTEYLLTSFYLYIYFLFLCFLVKLAPYIIVCA